MSDTENASSSTAAVTTNSSSSIFPEKFDGGDFSAWLLQFETCAAANTWDDAAKLRKLPAFLRGRAATHYYALAEEQKNSYANLTTNLKSSLCPQVEREKYFQEFEHRKLRPGEDPAVFNWELQQLLDKANPTLGGPARTALLERQFMRGLPMQIKLKLLEHDPVPKLENMIAFVQRYRAVEVQMLSSAVDQRPAGKGQKVDEQSEMKAEISLLAAAVKELTAGQKDLNEKLSKQSSEGGRPAGCYNCGSRSHFARDCPSKTMNSNNFQQQQTPMPRSQLSQNRGNFRPFINSSNPSPRARTVHCFRCGQPNHVARFCTANLN